MLGEPIHIIYDSYADYETLATAGGIGVRGRRSHCRRCADATAGNGEPILGPPARPAGRPERQRGRNDLDHHRRHDAVLARSELEWAASHDALTGLANRQAFEAG